MKNAKPNMKNSTNPNLNKPMVYTCSLEVHRARMCATRMALKKNRRKANLLCFLRKP